MPEYVAVFRDGSVLNLTAADEAQADCVVHTEKKVFGPYILRMLTSGPNTAGIVYVDKRLWVCHARFLDTLKGVWRHVDLYFEAFTADEVRRAAQGYMHAAGRQIFDVSAIETALVKDDL